MKLNTFFIGLAVTFGLPWVMIVAYPFLTLKSKKSFEYENKDGDAKIFAPVATNHAFGAKVYQAENCQQCHTQVVRNSLAGSDVFKSDWAGMKVYDADGNLVADTRRESIALDYKDSFASVGSNRIGPDLMNYGMRIKAKVAYANEANKKRIESGEITPFTEDELIYLHLYNPRYDRAVSADQYEWSTCSAVSHLFDKVSAAGQGGVTALPIVTKDDTQIVPSYKAKALKDYLLSLDNDDILPEELNRGPKQSD